MPIIVHPADRQLSLRAAIALGSNDLPAFTLALQDAEARPGGVVVLVAAMSEQLLMLAHKLDGDLALDSLRLALLQLTQTVEGQPGSQ